jgi:DICT domain-containing protein
VSEVYEAADATIDDVRSYAPTLADKIESAENTAEEASVAWRDGGPGGVQAKIDSWVSAWLEALGELRAVR